MQQLINNGTFSKTNIYRGFKSCKDTPRHRHDTTVFYHTKQNSENKRQSEHGACTCHIIPVMKKGVPKEPPGKTAICGTIVVMKDYYTGEQWEAFELFISAFLLAAA